MVDPHRFAADWIDAWNQRDLEAILSYYIEDIIFHSPYAARVLPGSGGIVRGKEELRGYWEKGLIKNPDLQFTLIKTVVGARSLCLLYRNHRGFTAAETMVFGADGLITSSYAHYTEAEIDLEDEAIEAGLR